MLAEKNRADIEISSGGGNLFVTGNGNADYAIVIKDWRTSA
jgi:hypothetical protein